MLSSPQASGRIVLALACTAGSSDAQRSNTTRFGFHDNHPTRRSSGPARPFALASNVTSFHGLNQIARHPIDDILAVEPVTRFTAKEAPCSIRNLSEDLFELRKEKLEEIVKLGQAAYPNQFPASHTVPQVRAQWGEATAEALEAQRVTVAVAGRIMAIRAQGKAGFATLQQEGQRLQIYVRLDAVGEQGFALYKLLDLGDHIGVIGLPLPHADRRADHPRRDA